MKLKILITILALQSAWILGTTWQQESALREGTPILLETRRADPRDLLRGDYLILRYPINDVPVDRFMPPVKTNLDYGVTIYVALAPGTNQFYEVARASTEKIAPEPGQVLVRGKATSRQWWNAQASGTQPVEYGLERYYVGEGTGNPTGKLTVQAVVPASGRASIKQVFVDGKPYAEAMKQ